VNGEDRAWVVPVLESAGTNELQALFDGSRVLYFFEAGY
jgi:hypothetical protein